MKTFPSFLKKHAGMTAVIFGVLSMIIGASLGLGFGEIPFDQLLASLIESFS